MADLNRSYPQLQPRLLSILRIVSAFMFMAHGSQKLFGLPGGSPALIKDLYSLTGAAGILEFFGGLLLMAGLFTVPVAFILSGQMAVAYFMRHAPGGFWPLLNRGELAALYSFLFLYISFTGGGAWSLDRLLRRK